MVLQTLIELYWFIGLILFGGFLASCTAIVCLVEELKQEEMSKGGNEHDI